MRKVTRKASDWLRHISDLHIFASSCSLRQYSDENRGKSVRMVLQGDMKQWPHFTDLRNPRRGDVTGFIWVNIAAHKISISCHLCFHSFVLITTFSSLLLAPPPPQSRDPLVFPVSLKCVLLLHVTRSSKPLCSPEGTGAWPATSVVMSSPVSCRSGRVQGEDLSVPGTPAHVGIGSGSSTNPLLWVFQSGGR